MDRISVACPFCMIMLDDGVKEKGADEAVKVSDISMLLLEAIDSIPAKAAAARFPTRGDGGATSDV